MEKLPDVGAAGERREERLPDSMLQTRISTQLVECLQEASVSWISRDHDDETAETHALFPSRRPKSLALSCLPHAGSQPCA
jgi:hypothetical protein